MNIYYLSFYTLNSFIHILINIGVVCSQKSLQLH